MNEEYKRTQELRERLREKMDACYQDYRERWLKMLPEDLIDNAEEIEAVTRMARNVPEAVSANEAEYLLQFRNPLEVVSDAWVGAHDLNSEIIDEELSHMLWELEDQQSAIYDYELETGNQQAEFGMQSQLM